MQTLQRTLRLGPYPRGAHLITRSIEQALSDLAPSATGLCQVFLQHTSAALSLNENADPDVRADLDLFLRRLVPESFSGFRHTTEGPDDMPAHILSSLLGCSLLLPITGGRLQLGTWQGIYLLEFRDHATPRSIVMTVMANGR